MASTEQTQQNNVVNIAFEDGVTAVYAATSGSVIQFSFDTDNVVFSQQGDDLVITDADGDVVVIDNYVALVEAGTSPQVLLEDGVAVAGDVFLFSVGQEQTAADAAASGGGLNDFFSDPGALLNGLDGALGDGSEGPGLTASNDFGATPDTQDDFSGFGDVGFTDSYVYPDIAESPDLDIRYPSRPHTYSAFSADPDDSKAWFVVDISGGNGESGGGANNDRLSGSSGDNILRGNGGHDAIVGNNGNDILYGGSGNDELNGGNGNDMFYGGGGYDTLYLGDGDDVIVFNADTFQDGPAIVEVNDFTLGEDGIKLEDGVSFEALRDYGTHVEAVLTNGSDDNVIVRLLGESRADFDAHIDSLGDGYAYSDTEQLLQYMAGNDNAWV